MNERPRKILTLCLIHEHPRVLLGMKKRGFGMGKWNGFGGKVESEESIEDAARRELREEAGIESKVLEKLGIIDFEFEGDPEIQEVHVFRGEGVVGEPKESDEMMPQWFDARELPFHLMWPDDRYWLPLLLERKKFRGKFLLGKNNAMLKTDLMEINEI